MQGAGRENSSCPTVVGEKDSEQARAMGTSEHGVTNSNPAAGAGRTRRAGLSEGEGVEASGGRSIQRGEGLPEVSQTRQAQGPAGSLCGWSRPWMGRER